MKRAVAVSCALAGLLLLLGALSWAVMLALVGRPAHEGEPLERALSPAALALVERSLEPFRADPAFDHHVHVVGVGAGGTGCRVNARFTDWAQPWRRMQFAAYQRAAGIEDLAQADVQYAERLVRLARAAGVVRLGLLAFDAHHGPGGEAHEAETEFYVPNEHVLRLARAAGDLCAPIASVHPYRPDALAELERCAAAGVRIVKWLPNAQGMDPADPRCNPFYSAMARLDLVLLSHAGEEQAVEAEELQELGNPLRLRRALDAGVRVIVAHCASKGEALDLDDPARPSVACFDLFLRLMDDPRYVGRVFGEISTLTQTLRNGRPLATMLARTDLHERLVNGSDWPLPGVDVIFRGRELAGLGYLSDEEARLVEEVWEVNPLLFDLVLKRTLRHPRTGSSFPPSVFRARAQIAPQ
jgi:predicted TIM-barrel fold metal-dependent hydrolase